MTALLTLTLTAGLLLVSGGAVSPLALLVGITLLSAVASGLRLLTR